MLTHKKAGLKHPIRMVWLWIVAVSFLGFYLIERIAHETAILAHANLSTYYVSAAHIALPLGLLFLVLALWQSVYAGIEILERASGTRMAMNENMRSLLSGQTQNRSVLVQIRENVLLSDDVKGVAFRQKDQEVIIEAIHQDMQSEQWASADLLITSLVDRFGCEEKGAMLKQELKAYQSATLNEKIERATGRIQELWAHHRFEDAQKLENNLVKMYGASPSVQALAGKTLIKRLEYKQVLLGRWDDAVKNNNIDDGIELLNLLDKYITPTEAAAMQEAARGVFKAKLHNLGVKFSLTVSNKNWAQALQVGNEIIEEFPNSRMAQEVRNKLDILETRANEA